VPLLVRNVAVDFRVDEDGLLQYLLQRLGLQGMMSSTGTSRGRLWTQGKSRPYDTSIPSRFPCATSRIAWGSWPAIPISRRFPCCASSRSLVRSDKKIVIVGMGPAGLFAGLRLAEYGLHATFVERGRPVEDRVRDVETFWQMGRLDPDSNVQFGEGGPEHFPTASSRRASGKTAFASFWKNWFCSVPHERY